VDGFSESLISSVERQQVLSYPTASKNYCDCTQYLRPRKSSLPAYPYCRQSHLRRHYLLRRWQDQVVQEHWESLGNQVPRNSVKELHPLRCNCLHLSRSKISSNRQKAPRISQHHQRAVSDLRLAKSSPPSRSVPS
jgi:hypothetical protein